LPPLPPFFFLLERKIKYNTKILAIKSAKRASLGFLQPFFEQFSAFAQNPDAFLQGPDPRFMFSRDH
jgi:hypothetical protein